jgi:glycosyltransferase involved in cell wall biosynthesis
MNSQLKINIITQSNGKGLSTDQKVLKEALEQLDCIVTILDISEAKWNRAHINIFIQALAYEKFPMAQQNWFIPNPEWYEQPISFLDHIDLILCRTREVERIFREMNKQIYYLGFKSPDCYREEIPKNYRHFLHLAGGSQLKGTKTIRNIWFNRPTFPLLTVIDFLTPFTSISPHLEWFSIRIPEDKLRNLQNQCGIHLCPSQTEGFGHYIMEAMSACAVVVTTDAPPMNEFIKDPRCLVSYIKTSPINLATSYEVDPKQLESKIEYLLSLPNQELEAISEQNRSIYLQKQQEFYERLEELIWIALPLKEINLGN